jgi:hypothetical protein
MAGTLLVGDVHGCADELGELLTLVAPSRVILLGDLFTKGPDPLGVWNLVEDWEAEAVLGNQDIDVLETWLPGERLPRRAFKWLRERPLTLEGEDWIAVHAALHPDGPEHTKRKLATGMKSLKHGAWQELWRGPPLVVHGHSPHRGLLDRRPDTLGLDTGCVRGGRLTGWLAEKNRLVSVPALRDWTRD